MNEADLIRLAKQGNEKAYAEIFNRYKSPIYYFILRRVKNEADAEDLTMETFERAFARIIYFVPLVKLQTWLFEIAKNRIIDFIRTKKTNPVFVEYDCSVKDTQTPERICVYMQEFKIIQEGIGTLLRGRYRTTMEMYCLGWKMREIALNLCMPMGTVQNYIHRSKHKLRRLVA